MMTTDTSWSRLRKLVKNRDKGVCYYCGEFADNGHCDHKIPLSKGGTDEIENLVWACRDCNLSKGNKVLVEPMETGLDDRSIVMPILKALKWAIIKWLVPPYPDKPHDTWSNKKMREWRSRCFAMHSQVARDWLRRQVWTENYIRTHLELMEIKISGLREDQDRPKLGH